jgi:GNAT superfamily N-acetyltransferase
MNIIEVVNDQLANDFLLFPVSLYKNEKNWIRPLDQDILDIFDPKENKYFRNGECTRWVLKDANKKTIGRIAAFTDKRTLKEKLPSAGTGFFECINDQNAANILFETAIAWLKTKGAVAIDGPVNFGDRDKWWGLLVDGFYEPNYCMPYHFKYYQQLFENFGFKEYFKQYTYHRTVEGNLPEIYQAKADRIARDPKYRFTHINKNELEKYAEDFRYIYNKAWGKHTGVREMPKAQAMSVMNKLKPVLDEEILWFAYYDNEPIAFFIMIPELNQLFKHLNGKKPSIKAPIAALKFLWHKATGSCKRMFGVAFGVIPEYQSRGIEGAIVMAAAKVVQPKGKYTDFEMNWIGDFNPKMMRIAESAGGKIRKTHITYRYITDPNILFERMPTIE